MFELTPSGSRPELLSRTSFENPSDSSRPVSPASHLLTGKGGPGGRGSRRARKAANAVVAGNLSAASSGGESPSLKPAKGKPGKKMRKWGADGMEMDDDEDGQLDFSTAAPDGNGSIAQPSLEHVDASSWGTRNAQGQFMLKDIGDEMNAILESANAKDADAQASGIVGSGLATIGGMFRNVVGGKTLTKEDLDKPLKAMEDHLLKKNVAREAAVRLCDGVERELIGTKTKGFTGTICNHLESTRHPL
jgi:signal recognition particle receptor subunit alpha